MVTALWEQGWLSAVLWIPLRFITNTFERTDSKANCFGRLWRMPFEVRRFHVKVSWRRAHTENGRASPKKVGFTSQTRYRCPWRFTRRFMAFRGKTRRTGRLGGTCESYESATM